MPYKRVDSTSSTGHARRAASSSGRRHSRAGAAPVAATAGPVGGGEPQKAPLAGNIWKVLVQPGQQVAEGDVVIILEAMKMETEIRAPKAGTIGSIATNEGATVKVGDTLYTIA